MHELNWFSKDMMAKWEEINNNSKTWTQCQYFLRRHTLQEKDTSRQKNHTGKHQQDHDERLKPIPCCNRGKDRKKQAEHVQQVTQQNVTLITMVQEQQQEIEELMTPSKTLMTKMMGTLQTHESNGTKAGDKKQDMERKKVVQQLQKLVIPQQGQMLHIGEKKWNHPPWYNTHFHPDGTRKGGNQE